MNIVLEGCKASGKSTIAKHFMEKGYKYFHSSSKTENDIDYHLDLLLEDKRVIDRFSIGEMIYPSLYKRDGKLDWIQFAKTMDDRNTVYVVLYSSDVELIFNRIFLRGRKTEDEDAKFIKKSNEMFKYIGSNFTNNENIILIDILKNSTAEIIQKIEELLDEKI